MFFNVPFLKRKRSSQRENGNYHKLSETLHDINKFKSNNNKKYPNQTEKRIPSYYTYNYKEKRISTNSMASSIDSYCTTTTTTNTTFSTTTNSTTTESFYENNNYYDMTNRYNKIESQENTANQYSDINCNHSYNNRYEDDVQDGKKKKNIKGKRFSKVLKSFFVSNQYLQALTKCPDWEYYCNDNNKNPGYNIY